MVAALYIAPVMLFLLVSIAVILIAVFVGRSDSTGFTGLSGYTVGPTGNYKTIQAAVDAAAATGAPQTIYVQGGTYTEDVKISTSGITLIGLGGTATTVNLKGNLSLTAPNLVPFVHDIDIENINITGNILSTTPDVFYKASTHVGNIDITDGGATSRFIASSVVTSGGVVTVSGDGGGFYPQLTTVASPLTITGKASLNGSEAVFSGDLVLSQTVAGLNNVRGGAITSSVVLNAPASFAIVNANTTAPTWQAVGVCSILLVGCTGLAASQTFTVTAGGSIQFFKHFGGIGQLVMADSLSSFLLDHTWFSDIRFDIASGTTGAITINECTLNVTEDTASVLPVTNGGVFNINNTTLTTNRFRIGGTTAFNARNSVFFLNGTAPIGALLRLEDSTVVSSFNNCTFDTSAIPIPATSFNLALAATGINVTLLNCAVKNKVGDGIATSDPGSPAASRNIVRPLVGAAGSLQVDASGFVDASISLIAGTSSAV